MKETKTIIINSLPEMEKFTKDFFRDFLIPLKQSNNNKTVVLGLSGDLGAGKTTFVQLLAKELGVKEFVTSPTFTIMKSYETDGVCFSSLIHMDVYRIDDTSELGPLRFSEILGEDNNLICIEWIEKISSNLPDGVIFLSIKLLADDVREITYSF